MLSEWADSYSDKAIIFSFSIIFLFLKQKLKFLVIFLSLEEIK